MFYLKIVPFFSGNLNLIVLQAILRLLPMSTEDKNKYKKIELKYKKLDALSRILAAVAAIASAIAAFLALQNYIISPITTPNSLLSAPITPPSSSPQVDSVAPIKPTPLAAITPKQSV